MALEAGAMSYLDKHEFTPSLIARMVEGLLRQGGLQRQVAALERQIQVSNRAELVGASPEITRVREQLRLALADQTVPMLLRGERGTGKELAARSLFRQSVAEHRGAFVLGAIRGTPASMHYVQLFGCEGSSRAVTRGWLEEARGGILFLDEVSMLSPTAQQGLASAFRARRFRRENSQELIGLDTRVVAATSIPLDEAVRKGRLREDLYEQLNRFEVVFPPLRERRGDIPLLAFFFLGNLFRLGRTPARSFAGRTLSVLEQYDWPGNVTELRVLVEFASLKAALAGHTEIGNEHLPTIASSIAPSGEVQPTDYRYHLARAEIELVDSAARGLDAGTKTGLAESLGYRDRFTFARRMRRNLDTFPELRDEFPKLAAMFSERRK